MNTISKRYALVWELKDATHYKFTRCKKCFNTKTGRDDSNGELKEFSYEEAELACLKKLIQIVKEKL